MRSLMFERIWMGKIFRFGGGVMGWGERMRGLGWDRGI